LNRLSSQVHDELVTILPSEFFGKVMNCHKVTPLAEQALRKYPDILSSRLIIFPLICKSQFTLFAVSNPLAVIKPELMSRGVPFMMNLHPGSESSRPKAKDASRRLRLLLNRLADRDMKVSSIKNPFTWSNLKMFSPRGKCYES
jgi:hypothetical protein